MRLSSRSWINRLARAQPQLGLFKVTRTALHVSCLSVVSTTRELDLNTKAENYIIFAFPIEIPIGASITRLMRILAAMI